MQDIALDSREEITKRVQMVFVSLDNIKEGLPSSTQHPKA